MDANHSRWEEYLLPTGRAVILLGLQVPGRIARFCLPEATWGLLGQRLPGDAASPRAKEEGGVVHRAKGRLREGTHEDPWREEEAAEASDASPGTSGRGDQPLCAAGFVLPAPCSLDLRFSFPLHPSLSYFLTYSPHCSRLHCYLCFLKLKHS